MNLLLIKKLGYLKDMRFHPGINITFSAEFEREYGIVLPAAHWTVLQNSNGIEAYEGYFRLFGVRTTEGIDAVLWNRPDYWKFAWGDRCSGYWCFGETAWGDQYAYALESLCNGGDAKVYFLSAFSMTPRIIASSFDEFLEKEFFRSAREPYDIMITQARKKLGSLEATSHLVYVPSILLGGNEDINNVQKLNARSAMICNGDIANQLDLGPTDKAVKGVQPYEDESHRMRIRLVWA